MPIDALQPSIAETQLHRVDTIDNSADIAKIETEQQAKKFIDAVIQTQLQPVDYSAPQLAECPYANQLPQMDQAAVRQAVHNELTNAKGKTETIMVAFIPLAQLANRYHGIPAQQIPLDAMPGLQKWKQEELRIVGVIQAYSEQVSRLSNGVVTLNHAPIKTQGSAEDYGNFEVKVDKPKLAEFLARAKSLRAAQEARAREQAPLTLTSAQLDEAQALGEVTAGGQFPGVMLRQAEQKAEPAAVVTPDENEQDARGKTEEPADKAEAAPTVDEASREDNRVAPVEEVVTGKTGEQAESGPAEEKAEPEAAPVDKEAQIRAAETAYYTSPTLYELYTNMQTMVDLGGEFTVHKGQGSQRRELQYQARQLISVMTEVYANMQSGNWDNVVTILEEPHQLADGSKVTAVIWGQIDRIVKANYQAEVSLIKRIRTAATLDQALQYVAQFPEDTFEVPQGLAPDDEEGKAFRFNPKAVIAAIRRSDVINPDVRMALRLLPRLSELVSQTVVRVERKSSAEPVRTAEPVQSADSRAPEKVNVPENGDVKELAAIFEGNITVAVPRKAEYYNNQVRQELATRIATELNKTFPTTSDMVYRRVVVLINSLQDQELQPYVTLTSADRKYSAREFIPILQRVKDALSAGRVNTIDTKDVPNIFGLRSLVTITKNPQATMADYMREVRADYALAQAQQEQAAAGQQGGWRRWIRNPFRSN